MDHSNQWQFNHVDRADVRVFLLQDASLWHDMQERVEPESEVAGAFASLPELAGSQDLFGTATWRPPVTQPHVCHPSHSQSLKTLCSFLRVM